MPWMHFLGGSVRLAVVAGVDVRIHWVWFLAAAFHCWESLDRYSSPLWVVAELAAGTALILIHEFAHVFAARRMGGYSDRVLLWPLGGLAEVSLPPRPVAWFCTVAAGPLTHLVLAPALFRLARLTAPQLDYEPVSDLHQFLTTVAYFNAFMLVFNLVPLYPLDGGRLLQAVLWLVLGRARSQGLISAVSFLGWCTLSVFCWRADDAPGAGICLFAACVALQGAAWSWFFARQSRSPRRSTLQCPICRVSPPVGDFWRCGQCEEFCDAFSDDPTCAGGGPHRTEATCPTCGRELRRDRWVRVGEAPSELATDPCQTSREPGSGAV